jgi:uncharacterized protein DUF6519
MGADFSKVRSNPLLDYAGVELKQGAVLLDADANELVAIFDRRLRALAGDVLGRATVGANTPDAFRITLGTTSSGAQTLEIGRGRLYVDGLLAENHGNADPGLRVFDALMAEPAFSQPVPYETQPYLPYPPLLPPAGRHLVYLDVWNREVTHLEQPELVETAVGVETSSRLQTVWQVRVLGEEAGAGTTCGSPDAELPGWADVIAPSTGRLTTGTYEVAAVTDPCELPPAGGYRGLENQLYRVEIHDPGQPGGTATFKWSRDNASVGSRVAACISASELQLETLGRDEVLRFKADDWVEIIDDARELSQHPGEMRRISIEEGKDRQITLHEPLPADMLPASFPDNSFPRRSNLRVRLWSHGDVVLSTAGNGATAVFHDLDDPPLKGVIPVPASGTTLLLENGVTVRFGAAGPKGFRAGDYWVFAARTADASVEILEEAPPRGIHHHYARLALWDAGDNAEPSDCRHKWPPKGSDDCACTQCVTPESHASGQLTIEEAVRRVQELGGTVCLGAGQYALRAPVRLSGARSVHIKGQGIATVLTAPGCVFSLENSFSVAVENISMISTGKQPAVSVRSGLGIALHDLMIVVANVDAPAAAIALSGTITGLTIRDNLFAAPIGIRALDRTAPEGLDVLMAAALRVESNLFSCQRQALDLSGTVYHLLGTEIRGNDIWGCQDAAVSMLGSGLIGSSTHIENNTLRVNGPGIQCSLNFAWIEGNRVTGTALRDQPARGAGIALVLGFDPTGSDQCQVLANQVSDYPDAGILISSPVQDLICKVNIIERCGNGIVVLPTGPAGSVSIENNHLRNLGSARAAPELGPVIHGISVRRAQFANVAGNSLRRIGVEAVRGIESVAAIAHFAVRASRVSGNDIAEIGPPGALPGATLGGILLNGPYRQNEIGGNHVARDAVAATADAASWSAVLANEPNPARPIIHVADFAAVHLSATRMLVLDGTHAFAEEAPLDFTDATAPVPLRSTVAVRGNVLQARGAAPAVALESGADIQFGDNRCDYVGRVAAVKLDSSAAVVSANVVRGGTPSLELSAPLERATVVANATSGGIVVNQRPLAGTAWEALNVRI